MVKNKSGIIEHGKKNHQEDNEPSTEIRDTNDHNLPEDGVSPHFYKLAKKFMIDGALLPEEKQSVIEDRTAKRARLELLRKQNNIESIMQKTLGYCSNFEVSQRTDLDWFSRYIALSEEVSNPTMQDLWAKILAGELTKPGTFSFKALKIFKDMSIYDAKLLAKACSLAIKDSQQKNIRLITGVYQKPGLLNVFSKARQQYSNLSHYGLKHSDLLALAESHLIYIQESESSLISKGEVIKFHYNGSPINLTAKKGGICIQFYKFTPLGTELAHLISDKTNNGFFEHIKVLFSHYFLVGGEQEE